MEGADESTELWQPSPCLDLYQLIFILTVIGRASLCNPPRSVDYFANTEWGVRSWKLEINSFCDDVFF